MRRGVGRLERRGKGEKGVMNGGQEELVDGAEDLLVRYCRQRRVDGVERTEAHRDDIGVFNYGVDERDGQDHAEFCGRLEAVADMSMIYAGTGGRTPTTPCPPCKTASQGTSRPVWSASRS